MRRETLLIATYILAVAVTTAISGALGPLASVIDSFFGIGLIIVVRNRLHDLWEPHAIGRLILLIAMGTIGSLSVNISHPRIGVASGVAFFMANLAAMLTWPRNKRLAIALFAIVDSLVFPPIAFGKFTWWVVGGQIISKITGAAMWTSILKATAQPPNDPEVIRETLPPEPDAYQELATAVVAMRDQPPEQPQGYQALALAVLKALRATRHEYGWLAQRNWHRINLMIKMLAGTMLAIIAIFIGASIAALIIGNQQTDTLRQVKAVEIVNQHLLNDVQVERYDAAFNGCWTSTHNHDNTIAQLHAQNGLNKLAAGILQLTPTQLHLLQVISKGSTNQTALLIDKLSPAFRDCGKRAEKVVRGNG